MDSYRGIEKTDYRMVCGEVLRRSDGIAPLAVGDRRSGPAMYAGLRKAPLPLTGDRRRRKFWLGAQTSNLSRSTPSNRRAGCRRADVREPILFSDHNNTFLTVSVKCPETFASAVADCRAILPDARGHLLLFTGDKRRVAGKYRPPESLLWRDAGAALQTCAMAAFAYGFTFCPLGDTGRAILDQLEPPHEEFLALALGVFGELRKTK